MGRDGVGVAPACAESSAEPMAAEPMRVSSDAVSTEAVSGAVAEWVDQVGRFLGVLQVALEESSPRDDASAEVRALAGQLPALIRQCRAQVPTPEMIRTWVRSVNADGSGAAGVGSLGAGAVGAGAGAMGAARG